MCLKEGRQEVEASWVTTELKLMHISALQQLKYLWAVKGRGHCIHASKDILFFLLKKRNDAKSSNDGSGFEQLELFFVQNIGMNLHEMRFTTPDCIVYRM